MDTKNNLYADLKSAARNITNLTLKQIKTKIIEKDDELQIEVSIGTAEYHYFYISIKEFYGFIEEGLTVEQILLKKILEKLMDFDSKLETYYPTIIESALTLILEANDYTIRGKKYFIDKYNTLYILNPERERILNFRNVTLMTVDETTGIRLITPLKKEGYSF